jgi:Flp pilus assembly protein TadD
MANLFEQKDRRVIPNWRSFHSTWKLGELQYSKRYINEHKDNKLSIRDYLEAWEKNKSIAIAGDLISAAFVNRFVNNDKVKEAAEFILKSKDTNTVALNDFAHLILKPEYTNTDNYRVFKALDEFDPTDCFAQIRKYKRRINNHPYNPIAYVDLSRLYAILGLEDKSIRNMKIALGLSPENRFVLRAAARLFSHFDKFEFAHNLIRKGELVKIDPWITASEIALATILGKTSKYIKAGMRMISSDNFSQHSLTELASSIGTLDFLSGNRKKARKYLRVALNSPNDNSLAQIEWINNKDLLLDTSPYDYDILNNYEAIALNDYFNRKYDSALGQCEQWFFDLPFSKRPVIFGSHIANSLLNKTNTAIKFLKLGLHSHPRDPQIINNLAYSLGLENRIDEAEEYMNQATYITDINTNTKICLTATEGLISFRKGEIKKGSDIYQKAIGAARSTGIDYLTWLACLNYAREIILAHSDSTFSIENLLSNIPDNTRFPDIIKLKSEVINLFKKHA